MDVLTLVSVVVLAFGGQSSPPSSDPLPVILAAEQLPDRGPNPLFPLLETRTKNTDSAHKTLRNPEPRTGTYEPDFGRPNVPIFVPLGTPNLPRKDPPQNPLFAPLSRNRAED